MTPAFFSRFVCVAVAVLIHVGLAWLLFYSSARKAFPVAEGVVENHAGQAMDAFVIIMADEAAPSMFSKKPPVEKTVMEKETIALTTATGRAATAVVNVDAALETALPWIDKPEFAETPHYPAYPALAHKRGQQGTVWLEIWLSESGAQTRLNVFKSSGFDVLDQAARMAASRWVFLPYRQNGLAMAARVRVPVQFVLQ